MAGSKWANLKRRKAAQDKLAVVGTGGADKCQVQHLARVLLALGEEPIKDEADALALVPRHAQGMPVRKRAAASWRDWRP